MNDSFYYGEYCVYPRSAPTVVPIFLSVVIILSFIGNTLVLLFLVLYENLKSVTNIFILNLAISDFIFTITLPFWSIYHIWRWLFSEILCKIVTFVFFTGFYSSILFLTIMTIYRYLTVVHPLATLNTQKVTTGLFLPVRLWIISLAAAVPSVRFSSLVLIPHEKNFSMGCEDAMWNKFSMYRQNIFFLVAFIVMTLCYIQILRKIRRTRSHTKNRAVKLVFSIVAVFFLSWVPYNVVIFLKVLQFNLVSPFESCEVRINLDYAFYVCRLIAFSHCCLNPVFYAFVGVKFRRHFRSILHQMCSRQSPVEDQQNRLQTFSRGSMS